VDTKFDHSEGVKEMTKAAIIISAILVFAGVAAAGSLPGVSGGSDDTPTLDTPSLATTTTSTGGTTTAGTTTVENEPGEDISGPCDEAEHANDPRCTGVAPQAGDDDRADDGDRHGRNRGHGGDDDNGDDHGGNSGHDGGGDDD
jgi:hypothetical protein